MDECIDGWMDGRINICICKRFLCSERILKVDLLIFCFFFLRRSPQNSVEKESNGTWAVECTDKSVRIKDPTTQSATHFNFDRVFDPSGSQKEVYELLGQ